MAEAAERSGLAVKTIRRYFDDGILAGYITPGGHRRIKASSIDELTSAS